MTKNPVQPNVSDALFRISRGLSWCFAAEHNRANPWFLTDMLGDGALTLSFQGALEPSYNTDNVWNRGQFSSTEDAAYEAPNASGNWIPYTQELNGSPAAISSVFVGTMGPGGQSQRELFNVNTNSTSHRFLYSSYNAGGTNSYTINARRRTTGVGSSPDTFQDHEVVVFFRYLEQGSQLLLDIYCPRLDRWTSNSGSSGDPFSPINNVIVKEGPAVESIGFWATSFDHWDQRAIEEIAYNPFGLLDALNQPPAVIEEAPPGPVQFSGTADWAWDVSGDLSLIEGVVFTGTADWAWDATADLKVGVPLSGMTGWQWDASGPLSKIQQYSGMFGWQWGTSGNLSVTAPDVVPLDGTAGWTWDASGSLIQRVGVAGTADWTWTATAGLSFDPLTYAGTSDWAWDVSGNFTGAVSPASGGAFWASDGRNRAMWASTGHSRAMWSSAP